MERTIQMGGGGYTILLHNGRRGLSFLFWSVTEEGEDLENGENWCYVIDE